MCVTLPGNASAYTPDIPEQALNAYLQEAGYPHELVDRMAYGLKLDLFQHKAIFEKYHDGEPEVMQGSDDSEIGALSVYNFYPSYIVSRVQSGDFTHFRITYTWVWYETPTVCFTNKMAIAWDYKWGLVANTTSYEYAAFIGDSLVHFYRGNTGTSTSVLHQECNFDILYAVNFQRVNVHTGWMAVTVQTPTKSGYGQISYIGKMFHREFNPGGSIGSTGAPSLSISWGWLTSPGESQTSEFVW